MSIRDLILFGFLLVVLVAAVKRPIVPALAWVLFGVMNPHRMSWGLAYNFPFALLFAIATLASMMIHGKFGRPKGGAAAALLIVILAWSLFVNMFALQPEEAWVLAIRVSKILVMTVVIVQLIESRSDVFALVTVLALALGFFGVKGGVFVMVTGGTSMVSGPPDSPIDGNNSLGVGLSMVVPLLYFLLRRTPRPWLRRAIALAMLVCAIAVLGCYSRGAMLAVASMLLLFWSRSRNKLQIMVAALVVGAIVVPNLPEKWYAKMDTLRTYEEDSSAQGRIVAWQTATNIANDRFPIGGGFEWQSVATSIRYSPVPTIVLVAHSIYFQVLGSLGYPGLVLLLTFWLLVWMQCAWLRKHCSAENGLGWGHELGSMVQASLVGYAVGGAFLDLAFWELPYYLFAAVAGAKFVAMGQLQQQAVTAAPRPNSPTAAAR